MGVELAVELVVPVVVFVFVPVIVFVTAILFVSAVVAEVVDAVHPPTTAGTAKVPLDTGIALTANTAGVNMQRLTLRQLVSEAVADRPEQ